MFHAKFNPQRFHLSRLLTLVLMATLLSSGGLSAIATPIQVAGPVIQNPEQPPDSTGLSPAVRELLLQTVSKQASIPVSTLRIAESQPATWDGCMGIYVPDQACIQIAISGQRVIVTNGKRSWVYHVSEDGSRIVRNGTATSRLLPMFAPDGEPTYGAPEANVIFRSVEAGGLAGQITERVLLADGTLYRQGQSPNTRQRRIVEKKLGKKEVLDFVKVLEDQRFPNLNRLRYLSDAAFADYPTMTVQAMGSSVEYIDLEEANLPVALKRVIRAWKRL